jgi:hypothetical protein
MTGPTHLDYLTEPDLALLARVADGAMEPALLRAQPDHVVSLLAQPRVFAALFAPARGADLLVHTSPFLAFACLVERAAGDLDGATAVGEPLGARGRVPVFDTDQLREFVAQPGRRLFLAQLLTSYTHVASGAVWVRQRRRWRRRRFSELDMLALARLLDIVPTPERPGIYRRLGDLALFLTGVFPDYSSRPVTAVGATERLLRAAGAGSGTSPGGGAGPGGALLLLEWLGSRWYRMACATAALRTTALDAVEDVADNFSRARRVLTFITDRYLFESRQRWFPPPA